MSKLSNEECARFSGASWLLELVKGKGLEEAEKILIRRGIRNIPLAVKESDIDRWYKEERANLTICMTLISAMTLHDEFDFDTNALSKFIQRFNLKAECISKDYVTWQDLQKTIQEETGIFIPIGDTE